MAIPQGLNLSGLLRRQIRNSRSSHIRVPYHGPGQATHASAAVAISAKANVRLSVIRVVFFIEITSFLLDFSILSVRFLTSEEKTVDKILA